ncbi:Hsp90 cochaperone [Pseudocyphellaria aurata]|nr:Hsp90 cochaperone [Pseudocyphellaria aurata]
MADGLKAEGNQAFAAKNFDQAIEKFSQAIELEPTNHVLYSNRSGAYASKKDFAKALEDAVKTTELKPDWAKGWGRKGSALHGVGELTKAADAYEQALKLDPTNSQAKSDLAVVTQKIAANGASNPKRSNSHPADCFKDPVLIPKMAANPKTRKWLDDPEFMAKLQRIIENPKEMLTEITKDKRLIELYCVLQGIDMELPESTPTNGVDSNMEEAPPYRNPDPDLQQANHPQKAPGSKEEAVPDPEDEDEDAASSRKAKEAAEAEKKLGTENYKKRQFDAAIEHYSKAWDLHKDITYLTNMSAAKFEKGDFEGAIQDCKKAIEEGREVLADFKIIAKAFGRIGTSYERLGDLPQAIVNYQKSLTEHRTPDVLNKLRAAEKAQIKAEKEAYINPEEAEKARELGNQKFKEADWPGAVEAYSEMTKRAPNDPRGYSNRAAALIKLMTFPGAVSDCNEAIKIDPRFIRAYLRKAQAYFAMKEYTKCFDVCTEAMEHDEGRVNHKEIEQQQEKALQAQYAGRDGETEEETMERIQRDPEIMGILQDPIMQSILQQAKGDPSALQEHMKNAGIRSKITKLIAAGVIRTR